MRVDDRGGDGIRVHGRGGENENVYYDTKLQPYHQQESPQPRFDENRGNEWQNKIQMRNKDVVLKNNNNNKEVKYSTQ